MLRPYKRGEEAREQTESDPVFVLLILGLFPLLNSFSNPRFEGPHGFDFMQLIASGLCFGFGVLFGGCKVSRRVAA